MLVEGAEDSEDASAVKFFDPSGVVVVVVVPVDVVKIGEPGSAIKET